MEQEEEIGSVSQATGTHIVGALVLRTNLEKWVGIKEAVERAGGSLIFQKIARPQQRLWIVEREPEAGR